MAKILVLNGPNLNLLGSREPTVYGKLTLQDIETNLRSLVSDGRHELRCFQSNAEHELVGQVQDARADAVGFIIINPAAFTHTSIALRDAFLATGIPFIEVHISNVHAREPFRKHSYLSDVARGVIVGLGPLGYELALRAAIRFLDES